MNRRLTYRPRKTGSIARRVGLALLCGITVAMNGSSTWAAAIVSRTLPSGSGGMAFPGAPPPKNSNLTVAVSMNWIGGPGYVPVHVEVTPRISPPADRDLLIRLQTGSYYGYYESIGTTTVRLTIPAGASLAKAIPIDIPVPDGWKVGRLEITVIEDGESWDELHEQIWSGGNNSQYICVLDMSGVTSGAVRQNSNNMSISGIAVPELPTRWIDYTSVHIVISSVASLNDLHANHPQRTEALRRWVHSGGLLIVNDAGTGDSHLSKVAEQMRSTAIEKDKSPWQPLAPESLRDPNYEPIDEYGNPRGSAPAVALSGEERQVLTKNFQICNAGHGHVIATKTNSDLAPFGNYSHVLATLPNVRPGSAVGLQSSGMNSEFWNFLIPGVGKAPVWQFIVLITVFVVVIGPVNYAWLRKGQRLPLLLITVPLGAALVTVTLVAYAFLSDGLGVRLRARSLTVLDQKNGEATCAARLSYYAGLTPSAGLKFSEDTAIFPVSDEQFSSNRERKQRDLWWGDGTQHLRSGWLDARVPTQFMTLCARTSKSQLKVSETSGELSVQNELGCAVERLLLVNSDGKAFAAESLAPGVKSSLKPAADQDRNGFRDALDASFPVAPDDMSNIPYGYRGRSRGMMKMPAPSGVAPQSSNLEDGIARITRMLAENKLPQRTYVAIVKRPPEVETGVESAHEVGGFHLILGSW